MSITNNTDEWKAKNEKMNSWIKKKYKKTADVNTVEANEDFRKKDK